MRSHVYPMLLLTLLSAYMCFYNLGEPDIDHIRLESRRAEIARNMVESGDWTVPKIAGEAILTKPPLYFWAAAVCSLKTGLNEFTARMPSALAGIGTVLVTYLLGAFLFSRAAGLLAGLALLSTNIFLFESRFAELESILTFFITASIYCFFRWYRNPECGTGWFILFFCMLGLGFMTKGPFAFTFPLIPIVAWLLMHREARLLINRRFLWGLLLSVAIVLPWGIAILMKQPGFLGVVLWETLAYYIKGQGGHSEPFPYYFRTIPAVLFPWFLAFPLLVWTAFTKKLKARRKENIFLLLWIAGNFIFLTGSKSKRDFYLTPLAPALALLVGSTWGVMWEYARETLRLTASKTSLLMLSIGGAILTGTGIIAAGHSHTLLNLPGKEIPRAPEFLIFAGLIMLLTAAVKRFFPAYRFARIALVSVAAMMLAFHFFQLTYTTPIRNADESSKQFYIFLAKKLGDAPLAWFGRVENFALSFNAHRPITYVHDEKETNEFMASPKKSYILFNEKSIEDVPPGKWRVVLREDYSVEHPGRQHILVSNY